MLKLRILLLRDSIFYIIFLISVMFLLFTLFFSIKKDNFYQNKMKAKIIDIENKDYGYKLILKEKEKILGFYYIDDKNYQKELFLKEYGLGDIILVEYEDKKITNNTVENTFNYKKYLKYKKINKVISINKIELVKKNKNVFYIIKNHLLLRAFKLKRSYPYISSLLFGDNSYLNSNLVTSFRMNGISHLFAISGTHVSVFLKILEKILKRIKIKEEKRTNFKILFLLFYMFLTSFCLSVVRSSLFNIFLLINKKYYFHIKSSNLLLLSLAIMIFFNPYCVFDIGLQYSFIISLSLILMGDYLNRVDNKIYKLFLISFISFLVSIPITIKNFYSLNFMGVIYNLFFVPYISSIILPLVIISYCLPFFDIILYIFTLILEKISLFLSKIDILTFSFCKINVLIFILYYVFITIFFLGMINNKKRNYMFLILLLIINYFFKTSRFDYVTFFDVGQGDSIFLSVNNTSTLIDTGGVVMSTNDNNYGIAKNKIVPYLKSIGVKKLDNLIITHGDYDHMGESIYLVNNFKVDKVIFNCGSFNNLEKNLIKVLENKNIKYYSCVNEVSIGKYKLQFLNTKEYDNENDNSNVIYFKYQNYKFLFMGDAGVEKEKDILKKYKLENIDFLKVGHHGSNTSSSMKFIYSINPLYSLISVGENNKYNHPKKSVLDTLSNSKIYRTDMDGSIKVKLNKNGYIIKTCNP